MSLRSLLVVLTLGSAALPLHAQIRDVRMPARTWGGVFAGMYTNVDNIYDPGTDTGWFFGDQAFAVLATIEREVSQGLLIGIEGSYAGTDFERRDDNGVVAEGDANLMSAFVTGRLLSGGGGNLSPYLKGGIGGFGYKVPNPEVTNWDFALTSGAGVEYRFRPRFSVGLEWSQVWAYHEKEGLNDGNTGKHSLLRVGVRVGR